MRKITREEMVEGIAEGFYDWLNLQELGVDNPARAIPAAVGAAFQLWLDEHPEVVRDLVQQKRNG